MRKIVVLALLVAAVASVAEAKPKKLKADLKGFEEVPAISSTGAGAFQGTLNSTETQLNYTVTFDNLKAPVTQSHIHFAQKGVNGAIVIFLCTNLGNGPAGTQACPADGGTISGTISADDVLAVTAQGIEAGALPDMLKAIRQGNAYVNVHSTSFPGGEIRGQIRFGGPGDKDVDAAE